MRGHKFICLVVETYWLEGNIEDNSVVDQIHWCDDSHMSVLTFAHEKFDDNCVIIRDMDGEEHEFARDIDGRLWYVDQVLSKMDVIKLFEQRD